MLPDILGKIGEKAGTELNNLRVSVASNYATKVSLGNVVNTIDFTPYATKVSLGQTNSSVSANAGNISANTSSISSLITSKASRVSLGQVKSALEGNIQSVEDASASKVSLNAYATGANVFDLLKATRAELGELKVTGETTIVNTQTIEVSDNIIELNLADDGGETAQTSGIQINRGSSAGAGANNTGYSGSLNFISPNYEGGGWGGAYGNGQWSIDEVASELVLTNMSDSSTDVISTSSPNFESAPNSGFTITNVVKNSSNGVVSFDLTYASSNVVNDKATFLWDDTTSNFELKLGTSLTDLDLNALTGTEVKVPDENGTKN